MSARCFSIEGFNSFLMDHPGFGSRESLALHSGCRASDFFLFPAVVPGRIAVVR